LADFEKMLLIILLVSFLLLPGPLEAQEVCFYLNENQQIVQVRTLREVPLTRRLSANCRDLGQSEQLARPTEIELGASVRREVISSSLGPIELRWPRAAEALFGRTPERAVADAARSVSMALRRAGFSPEVRDLWLEWQIVFMDDKLPASQIPIHLISNCHPGWMTPPANIYIASTRVAAGCGGAERQLSTSVADSQLAEILLHEMAHVIEFHLLQKYFGSDRSRAEGFATWFETFSADYSSLIDSRDLLRRHARLAKQSFNISPQEFSFQGSAVDYARASMYFHAIVDRRGVGGVMEVYQLIKNEQLDFYSASMKHLGWSRKRLQEEALRIVDRNLK